ncbi:MAG: hypothetical protein ACD_24C00308G0001 [uncultured bacterium]|nr:MAG: hypothetical protein ACD_24C00308G0001 [uncultured bacterium]
MSTISKNIVTIQNSKEYNRIAHVYFNRKYTNSGNSYDIDLKTYIKPGYFILDFGCGPGNNFNFLLSCKPKLLVGVDISQKMLDYANLDVKNNSVIKLIRSSFEEFKINIKFDFILAHLSFVHVQPENLDTILIKCFGLLNGDRYFFANYFEGNDEIKIMESEWDNEKEVKRYFCFLKKQTLERAYKKAHFEIKKIFLSEGKSFNRINIIAKKP